MSKEHNGFLVSFEGIDQCGKTTQVLSLEKNLEIQKVEVEVYREPGSTPISEQVRRILLATDNRNMERYCEAMLYSAARAQLVGEKVSPALQRGVFVILDRYYDSTTAYQGYGRGIPIEFIDSINRQVSQGIKPDVTFMIDISPEEAIHRRDETGRDRLERSSLKFFNRVREGYLQIAKTDSRFLMIDGLLSPNEIEKIVWDTILSKVKGKYNLSAL